MKAHYQTFKVEMEAQVEEEDILVQAQIMVKQEQQVDNL